MANMTIKEAMPGWFVLEHSTRGRIGDFSSWEVAARHARQFGFYIAPPVEAARTQTGDGP